MKSKKPLQRTRALALTLTLIVCNSGYVHSTNATTNVNVAASNPSGYINSNQRGTARHRARTFDVVHYVIKTRFDVSHKKVIGEVDVTLKPLSTGFSSFELDAAHMKIEQVTLSDETVLTSRSQTGSLLITLDRVYSPADTITVRISYHTIPQRGLYFVSASSSDGFQRPQQIWTQGEPEDNHYWFPCYDFPDDKATSEQFITTAANEIAIANGVLVETIDNPNDTRTFHWRMNQPHSSYLISLVVGDYTKLTDSVDDVSFEYYTYRGTEKQALRAFRNTPKITRWFGDVLGHRFPYERYAQTVVGDFIFGGMENITATTFADTEILDDIDKPFDSSKLNLVSHELAHSWFGDLVTCKDWSHLWLNEGFATFMEAAFLESQYGREAYLQELRTNAAYYFGDDWTRMRHPLVNPNYPLTIELFDATTYKKGALVVHMLRETVGDELFWRALNLYLSEFKYRNVDSRDLQSVFERVSGQSLSWFFDQWVYKAGYPALRVRAKYDQTRRQLMVSVTQTQKLESQTPAVFRLPIDIEISTASGVRMERIEINRRTQQFLFQLNRRPQTVTIDKGFRVLKTMIIQQSRSMLGFELLDGADVASHHRSSEPLVNREDLGLTLHVWSPLMSHYASLLSLAISPKHPTLWSPGLNR